MNKKTEDIQMSILSFLVKYVILEDILMGLILSGRIHVDSGGRNGIGETPVMRQFLKESLRSRLPRGEATKKYFQVVAWLTSMPR